MKLIMKPIILILAIVGTFAITASAKDNIEITVVKPKGAPTLEEVNSGKYLITLLLTNTSKEKKVLWPFVSMQVMNDKGKKLERSTNIGAGGRASDISMIETLQFVTLAPGKSHKIEIRLDDHYQHPTLVTGWQLPAKGKYKVQLLYSYDRAVVKKIYGEGCRTLEKATAQWNLALEVNKQLEIELTVK